MMCERQLPKFDIGNLAVEVEVRRACIVTPELCIPYDGSNQALEFDCHQTVPTATTMLHVPGLTC